MISYTLNMLYILIGLPYSGKTTLTQELVSRLGFSKVSIDDVINERELEVEKMTQKDWNEVYSEGYVKVKTLLREGKTVVLDLANLKRSERQTAKNIAKSLGKDSKVIYLNIPSEEIIRRWEINEKTRDRDQLEEMTLQRAFDMFQEPAEDENYIIYHQQMDLDKWIEENILPT